MKVLLQRTTPSDKQTLGKLSIIDGHTTIFQCFTLELAWKNNKHAVSCIPKGSYNIIPYNSPSKGSVYLLQDVPNRTYIEIHAGNYYRDIQGCILVGDSLCDINNDGYLDVTNSKATLVNFLTSIDNRELVLEIV